METIEDIVIVGGGIAGLATALGLHRLGIRSVVLESSGSLRTTGFAFMTWNNAWKALDALGIGDLLRQKHTLIERAFVASMATGLVNTEASLTVPGKSGRREIRCVKRKMLLDTLQQELPQGTIRFSSKVVLIEQSGTLQLVHLADGSILKTKVLIGCDGVNSVVSKWLGLETPAFVGRSAVRGLTEFPEAHGFKPEFFQFFGDGTRTGFAPCDEKSIYWFFTYTPSPESKEGEESALKMKQFVLHKLGKLPEAVKNVIANTGLDGLVSSPLRFRKPWELLWMNICRGGICVAGDALHPMTPDLGQGACSALEDGVTLARCLGEAFQLKESKEGEKDQDQRIRKALEKYAKERRWRSFSLVSTALVMGWIQQREGKLMNFVRDKWLSTWMVETILRKADFDPGTLYKC